MRADLSCSWPRIRRLWKSSISEFPLPSQACTDRFRIATRARNHCKSENCQSGYGLLGKRDRREQQAEALAALPPCPACAEEPRLVCQGVVRHCRAIVDACRGQAAQHVALE